MSRYSSYDRGYDSDDSTLVNDRRRGGPGRHRSPSVDSYSPRRSRTGDTQFEEERGPSDGTRKAAIAVGLLAAVAALLHIWSNKRRAEDEREDRRRRRKAFERAKATRRTEEKRREAQRQWDAEAEPQEEVKRIGYMPARARSRSRPRMIEQGPSELDGDDDSEVDQRRYRSGRRRQAG